jgi:hypothetical protein
LISRSLQCTTVRMRDRPSSLEAVSRDEHHVGHHARMSQVYQPAALHVTAHRLIGLSIGCSMQAVCYTYMTPRHKASHDASTQSFTAAVPRARAQSNVWQHARTARFEPRRGEPEPQHSQSSAATRSGIRGCQSHGITIQLGNTITSPQPPLPPAHATAVSAQLRLHKGTSSDG